MLLAVFMVSFVSIFTALYATKKFKTYLEKAEILGIDQHKLAKPRIATSGGMAVLSAALAALLLAIALDTFLLHYGLDISLTLAAIASMLIAALIGFLDDVYVGAKLYRSPSGTAEYRIGLKQWQKPLLIIAAAVPLMVVRAGQTKMALPFLGVMDFWIFYPLLLIPLAVVCVSNAYNMLAGFNGLEGGMGFVAFLSLGIYTFILGKIEASLISFAMAFALLGFLKYNWYPAKILPGDSLTYLAGAAFASAVVLSGAERFGILIFTPWIVEALLKLRAKFKASNIGILQDNGKLISPSRKVYSLTHLAMHNGKLDEKNLVKIFIISELIICLIAFILCYFRFV